MVHDILHLYCSSYTCGRVKFKLPKRNTSIIIRLHQSTTFQINNNNNKQRRTSRRITYIEHIEQDDSRFRFEFKHQLAEIVTRQLRVYSQISALFEIKQYLEIIMMIQTYIHIHIQDTACVEDFKQQIIRLIVVTFILYKIEVRIVKA